MVFDFEQLKFCGLSSFMEIGLAVLRGSIWAILYGSLLSFKMCGFKMLCDLIFERFNAFWAVFAIQCFCG